MDHINDYICHSRLYGKLRLTKQGFVSWALQLMISEHFIPSVDSE